MTSDRYVEYYDAKLWQMLPAIYRALDSVARETTDPPEPGPLREMVRRVAVQAAVLRRSVDRLWEDQSIETCDDWIIPYIGDLVATQLVACLDPAGKRRDVAKTIYYRRRKGTVGLLEELASDIASRDARLVEFFRRLSRTRHNFDPPIARLDAGADGAAAIVVEGLIGASTATPMGGYADLRNVYGASRAGSAFDEYFYTADFRRGRQSVGWHNIPKAGVFIWWLKTFALPPSTPVQYKQCPKPVYTFDPTGREVPLFSATRRASDAFGEHWVSPKEWELPGPIDQTLFDREHANLYPDPLPADPSEPFALAVKDGGTPVALSAVAIAPADGRFYLPGGATGTLTVTYNYAFGSEIGAGPYDQRRGAPLPKQPAPVKSVTGGGAIAAADIAAIDPQGTLLFTDSLTYKLPGNLGGAGGIADVLIQGDNGQRPVIRALANARPQWTIKGAPGAKLTLQGLHLVGADLVLTGEFALVQIRCATLDPGNTGAELTPAAAFATAADGQTLWPTRLFVEAKIADLMIAQSITGPIRTRKGGRIETLRIDDSIVQALPEKLGDKALPAIASDSGKTRLSRTTVLGRLAVHRLDASECIIDDVTRAEDAQSGCIRFSAYAAGSVVHQPYESVTVAPLAELFRSRDFGRPHYARLRDTADQAIIPGSAGASVAGTSIMAGAEDGSEMGAFCREKTPLKRRGLNQKFAEFMPIGQVPVWIDAT
jgi:hypothetical protein